MALKGADINNVTAALLPSIPSHPPSLALIDAILHVTASPSPSITADVEVMCLSILLVNKYLGTIKIRVKIDGKLVILLFPLGKFGDVLSVLVRVLLDVNTPGRCFFRLAIALGCHPGFPRINDAIKASTGGASHG